LSNVVLATYPTTAAAELVRGFLEEEGIVAWLGNDLVGTVLGGYVGPTVGVQVLVREEDLARARAVIGERKRRRRDG